MNSDLQNKMFHFEADPPPEVWDKITNALDTPTEENFPQRLFHYQEQPPAAVWEKLQTSLNEPGAPAIKVVPITRFKKPVRYAAVAASIIAVIVFATTLNNGNDRTNTAGSHIETNITTNQSSVLPSVQPPLVPEEEPKHLNQTAAGKSTENTKAKASDFEKEPVTVLSQNLLHSFSFSRDFIPEKADKEDLFDDAALASYMVYSNSDGIAMKLPKKLFSLVNCQDGDESCRERVHQLQQKLANSFTTTDFTGILEILRQLQ